MRKLLFGAVIFLFSLSFFATGVFAKDSVVAGGNIKLQENETVEGDYFAAGDQVEIYGSVTGDVYAAGGIVIIDGQVGGDVLAAGGTITIGGSVAQNVRALGGQVNVRAQIGRNLSVAGGNIDISDTANVTGNLAVVSGSVNVDGPIGGNVQAGVGSLVLSNTVDGDVNAGVGALSVTSGAQVNGNLTYYSDNQASISESAVISGGVNREMPTKGAASYTPKFDFDRMFKGFGSVFRITSILTTFVIGVLLVYFYPDFMKKTSSVVKTKSLRSFFIGLSFVFLAPIVLVLVAITIIGLPLVFIFGSLWMIIIYLSRIFVIYFAGELLASKFSVKSTYLALFIGVILYYFIGYLGVIGGLISFVAIVVGTGAYLISGKTAYLESRKRKII